jgi:hypothetical protein
LLIASSVTGAMIAYYLNTQGAQRPLNFMFVCVPGPSLALLITFALTRFSPRLASERLVDLTLWTLSTKSAGAVNCASVPDRRITP